MPAFERGRCLVPQIGEKGSMKERRERCYPPFWEHAVPIAVGILVLVIAVMIAVIFAVALGVFPGSG
jgi:hypothetical protein